MVRYNNVHNVMYLFEDGGGIYTLSKQPGSFVSENFVHDITIAPWARYGVPLAFYLDEGSEGITVANNVIQAFRWVCRYKVVVDWHLEIRSSIFHRMSL